MFIPDPEWKQRVRHESWYAGDTANMAIGQGDDLVSPLEMATLLASIARNEVTTKPTLIHKPNAPRQQSEPIGLTPEQRAVLLKGMEGVTNLGGTAGLLATPNTPYHVPGVRIAGKTGTAQKDEVIDGKLGKTNFAWFVGFAPVENPQVAFAVLIEPDEFGEMYGGQTSGPIAGKILKKYFEQKAPAPAR
jgi:penicillin-binding protein 2